MKTQVFSEFKFVNFGINVNSPMNKIVKSYLKNTLYDNEKYTFDFDIRFCVVCSTNVLSGKFSLVLEAPSLVSFSDSSLELLEESPLSLEMYCFEMCSFYVKHKGSKFKLHSYTNQLVNIIYI